MTVPTQVLAILSAHETGSPAPRWDVVTILPDGAGVDAGFFQATDRSGSLDALVLDYITNDGPAADQLRAFLPLLAANGTAGFKSLVDADGQTRALVALLRTLGNDPVWRTSQLVVFEREYIAPVLTRMDETGITSTLGMALLADLANQSGPSRIDRLRLTFPERPPVRGGSELAWLSALNGARRRFLTGLGGIAATTTYRCDTFDALLTAKNWELRPPFQVRAGHASRPVLSADLDRWTAATG